MSLDDRAHHRRLASGTKSGTSALGRLDLDQSINHAPSFNQKRVHLSVDPVDLNAQIGKSRLRRFGQGRTPPFDGLAPPEIRSTCERSVYVFIDSKKLAFVFVSRSLPSRNSIASIVPIGFRIRRNTYIFFRMSGRHEQLLFSGAGPRDVHRRERAFVGHLAIEDDFRIAGSLELFENDFIHA